MVEAAFSNLFIVSSNCPNGPSEFLDNNRNGILFENNKLGELTKSFEQYGNIDNKNKYKYGAKKNAKKYTKFRHFTELEKIFRDRGSGQ